jgi:hypothetical protein
MGEERRAVPVSASLARRHGSHTRVKPMYATRSDSMNATRSDCSLHRIYEFADTLEHGPRPSSKGSSINRRDSELVFVDEAGNCSSFGLFLCAPPGPAALVGARNTPLRARGCFVRLAASGTYPRPVWDQRKSG